ncbi:MAG TPA: adenylosuccinate synthase [Oligoflexus sp.]|uniref:adenylosuccinate synthase n=1 Tax=Oligoflexus sp. TaxID=1971216 RepID=UPI002D613658|nr:adenylosuccinate synthase [Oligoflexus sp.]HYX33137.1 adenylosuccinate synthase [Oligoflexus sp.]
MGNVTILVGAQWGDEGKGKWIDIMADSADIVTRYQGGNNAGHTLYVDGQKVVLHQIPSGIFHPGKISALTTGVVVNPYQLVEEMRKVSPFVTLTPERLWLSARAHVISPWHIHLDGKKESESSQPIGTTKRGIGPTYAEKANRTGLRLGDYANPARRERWYQMMRQSAQGFGTHQEVYREDWARFEDAATQLAPFICDAEVRIRAAIESGKRILLEGAQGVLLDINHGTYPYVTSSETAAGGAFASLGFSPKRVDKIYGVAKAYVTRVGEGALPTELKCETGQLIATRGKEFGATTGRPRRCGWLDAVALHYSAQISGYDGIILNKMDILTDLPEVKVCVAYEHPELGRIEDFPWDHEVLTACKPIYKTFAGWKEEMPRTGRMSDLPVNARKYVEGVEEILGYPISMVGTGVNRQDALFR